MLITRPNKVPPPRLPHRLALRRGSPLQPMAGLDRQGLGELGLAASPTESVSWPSTSPPQPAAPPLATSPPGPWGSEGCQSPTEAWEMFSRSPNTAFLHSCQSPPSAPVFSPQPPPQSPQPVQPLPVTSQLPLIPQGHPADLSLPNTAQEVCPGGSQPWDSFPPSPTSPTRGENPFLPTTNPFLPLPPVNEVAGAPPQSPVESPRVVVGPGGGGCSPGRPVWTEDFFSSSKSKNVICS